MNEFTLETGEVIRLKNEIDLGDLGLIELKSSEIVGLSISNPFSMGIDSQIAEK